MERPKKLGYYKDLLPKHIYKIYCNTFNMMNMKKKNYINLLKIGKLLLIYIILKKELLIYQKNIIKIL